MDGELTNPVHLPLVTPRRSLPSKPLDNIKTAQAKLDAIVQYAAKVQDWPLLVEAVDAKIEDQREFVQWWDDAVGVRLHAGTELSADGAQLSPRIKPKPTPRSPPASLALAQEPARC
jgi:hypothetical protein